MRAALELARGESARSRCSRRCFRRARTPSRRRAASSASLGNDEPDNWHWHMYDTVKGSDYLGDQDAIEFMCRKANEVVVELEHFGMPFDRLDNGKIYQRPFGGHTSNYGERPVKRACAAADRTGHAMLHTLYQRNVARAHAVLRRMDGARPDARPAQGDVLGVVALEMETGEVMILQAKATLLATGGAGRIYAASTNAFINTGDGLGMAARAGIPLEDMEFWQFHPTGVAGAGVLITEGVRGEGGFLLNKNGERFMERYAPDGQGPREPRRRLARDGDRDQGRPRRRQGRRLHPAQARPPRRRSDRQAAARASARSRRSSPTSIRSPIRFRSCRPAITRWAASRPTTTARSSCPTAAAARRSCAGFYAAGECACVSVHGANRLGTNSLLDLLVFGKASGETVIARSRGRRRRAAGSARRTRATRRSRGSRGSTRRRRARRVAEVGADMRRTMQLQLRRVPLSRRARRRRAQDEGGRRARAAHVHQGQEPASSTPRASKRSSSTTWSRRRSSTMVSAEARKESRGAHDRSDYPDRRRRERARRQNGSSTRCGTRTATASNTSRCKLKPLTVEPFEPKAHGCTDRSEQ